MEHLPIFLDVRGKPVVIVGGGTVAARKAEMALRAGARACVFAPELGGDFQEIAGHEHLTHHARAVQASDLQGCAVAYCASENAEDGPHLHALAKTAGVLVNVVDNPELCDFIMPAIVDRDPLVIGVSSGGASPILARIIKARLESMIPAAYGRLARFAGKYRAHVMERLKTDARRRRFWERIIDGPAADLLLAGQDEEAEEELNATLDASASQEDRTPTGEVYLVGAGPGDPDLLTFRALRLIQRADIVLYDRLIPDCVLNLVRRDAERIYVGKLPKDHTLPQEDISKLMVRLARQGKRVLRLKGGDPFIFGRGGEEIEELARENIPFQVVPGITAASGCSTYAGIPLTHRDHAQACIFVTGHGKDGVVDLDWKTLLQPHQTVVIYMGLNMLGALTREFIARGADPALPAAIIDNGTRRNQRVVTGTLADLEEKANMEGIKGPALIFVGTVVTLHDKLKWYAPDSTGSQMGDCLRSMPLDPVEVSSEF